MRTAPSNIRLSEARKSDRGIVVGLAVASDLLHGVAAEELERRLLEIGFVEGARFEVLEEGLFGRDPLALRLDDMRVALRRREAAAVIVAMDPR